MISRPQGVSDQAEKFDAFGVITWADDFSGSSESTGARELLIALR
jgi:hypothetical protein